MEEWQVRLRTYFDNGFPPESLTDERAEIRFYAYGSLGYTINAKTDTGEIIRLSYYLHEGFDEDAKTDTFWKIRLYAYRNLGWTIEALNDENEFIRLSAQKYLPPE